MARVSIVMPNLNNGRYISEAIDSIRAQTFGDFELIVVDNGSSDDSCERVASYQNRDPRVKLVVCGKRGARYALNMGIEEARGEYLTWMASDDLSSPMRIAKQIDALDAHPEFGACYTDGWTMDQTGRRLNLIRSRDTIGPSPAFDRGEVFRLLLKRNFIIGASVMVRVSVLGDERFDESVRFAEDWSFSLRLAKRTRFKCIEEPLYGYRLHGGATSSFRNLPSNSYNLAKAMVRWMKTIDMEPEDKRQLLLSLLTGPARMSYAVVRRKLGRA